MKIDFILRKMKINFCFLGITEENLNKLLSHALIPTDKKNIIANMQYLNLQMIQDQSRVCHWLIEVFVF
jgi:hypothetical protein